MSLQYVREHQNSKHTLCTGKLWEFFCLTLGMKMGFGGGSVKNTNVAQFGLHNTNGRNRWVEKTSSAVTNTRPIPWKWANLRRTLRGLCWLSKISTPTPCWSWNQGYVLCL